MQTNEGGEKENITLTDNVLVMILSRFTTSELLKAMVLLVRLFSFIMSSDFQDCLQEVVAHNPIRACNMETQDIYGARPTRKIPTDALFISEQELFCAGTENM